ncbi:hypothetical protein QBC35DRAFT_6152 [Podospora australis]|uniref:Uncharacterized protein n=1 Tax=Podospora australis TaxID=1536484 RepID=A0AAN7AP07_9PEZI|nr:hypothetical protein QBC35DRAFT_6152 [Podospora australis]
MPVPVAAKIGIVAASVTVAAAIAIYEIPEVRRVADDLRRRVAIALRTFGDGIDPHGEGQPRFNRPEDAHGFYESAGVDADEETRRRQREELMYWNSVHEERNRRNSQSSRRGSTFDDFLQPDAAGERGTMVFNTGAEVWDDGHSLTRRRGNVEGVRGLNAAMISNPFSDEYGIEMDEQRQILEDETPNLLAPGRDEMMSDIYNATPRSQSPVPTETHRSDDAPEVLFDVDSQPQANNTTTHEEMEQASGARTPTNRSRSMTLDREFADAEAEYMTASSDDEAAAYASIQAWARNSTPGFYSPLPVSPQAPLSVVSEMSEAEMIGAGHLTPTDTMSVAESAVDVGNDAVSMTGDGFDAMSDSDDGVATPNSWSEVGSVISDTESAMRA